MASDKIVVRDEVVGACPKSECHGDLHPVTGWGAWIEERCDGCRCSWAYQRPRGIGAIAAAAQREKRRREALALGPAA